MSFFHFTLLQVTALAFLSFCIKLAPADRSPAAAAAFTLPPCNPNSSWISKNVSTDDNARNLTLFKLSFHTNQSLSFNFTTTYNDIEDGAPGLVYIIAVTLPLQVEPSFPCMREQYTFSQPFPHHVCNPQLPQLIIQAPTLCLSDPYTDSDETHFTDLVSLTYDAVAAALDLQEFIPSTNKTYRTKIYLQPDGVDLLTLFAGFITSGEASINVLTSSTDVTTGVSTMNSAPSSENIDDDNAKSNHKKVVVWVIVGISMMALLMGLSLLVLFITKCRRGPPSLVSSRPVVLGAPPSATSRAPFSHRNLKSSTTPMMKALPLSPPHDTNAFQISATPTWMMKPPNPR